ncbi:hypothetical protein GCM10010324_35010 [Streptomyces hiroshimensis]|uniref:Uncharacterized protein n=1 Tax=Streptomyces hiroshimensis TaxID=66424 RepID=A0ABQ2YMP5_9ACTN|nr:hypothetical protein GCM10010324_35010 [Streptomyces hiroshimensis]
MARKPSHFASYSMPGGIFATDLASIGCSGGITGRSMTAIVRAPGPGRLFACLALFAPPPAGAVRRGPLA